MRWPPPRTAAASFSGWVDPHSRLMLRPFDSLPMTVRSKPSSANSRGATVVVAPFAVSIASLNRPRLEGSGSASRACAMYASMTSVCSTGGSPPPPGTDQLESATIASTRASSASVNFSPRPENTLMPLSSNGLWDALITSPASKPSARVMYAVAGVGMMPADAIAAPSA